MNASVDLVLINPGGREKLYQSLASDFAAVEPPLWCRLIGGYARDRGFSVAIVDAEALQIDNAQLIKRVEALAPQLIGMVVFGHQPSASTQQMANAHDACVALKDAGVASKIIMVGGHISALPERTLREEPIDFACKGEGPVTIVQLLTALRMETAEGIAELAATDPMAAIDGLVWWKDGEVVVNKSARLIEDLTSELHGNVWDLLPMHLYKAHNWQCFGDLSARQPYASIYTSLGCPYKCSFCCINAPFDINRYRTRTPESVVAEIDHLVQTYGVKTFKIIDEMFVLNERHVLAICDLLIERNYGLNIWAYARVDTVRPRMLEKLRKAGIRWLALGIESGSRDVRDNSLKALRNNDIVDIVRQIQLAGISVIGNYIFGLPQDTLESMTSTLELAKELNCEFANFYSAMAYPGSPLYEAAVRNSLPLPDSWSGYSQHSYDCLPLPTETLSAAEVLGFRDAAFSNYFAGSRYLSMVAQRFGWETRAHIEDMASRRLDRKILEAEQQAA